MPGLPSLGEKRWAHPLPLATIPPGAWHRYTPPCLCAPWHPSHGLICHSLTLAPSTGLAHGRQLSGPGQHLSPLPFSHINCVLSIVRDINRGRNCWCLPIAITSCILTLLYRAFCSLWFTEILINSRLARSRFSFAHGYSIINITHYEFTSFLRQTPHCTQNLLTPFLCPWPHHWFVYNNCQINGVAMDTKMGPSYANLFVGYIEHKFFNQYNGPKPDLYCRYIDDCVGATSSTREELNQFITPVNSFHPALKYTWEISDTSLAFLDIKLSIEGNGLCTSVHYKPTDSHSYLLYSSSHPSHVKNSIPYSQLLRLRRLCSEDSDFSLKSEEMCHFFNKRGYPASVIQAGHHRAQQIDRQSALQTSQKENNNRIPFTLTTTQLNPSF